MRNRKVLLLFQMLSLSLLCGLCPAAATPQKDLNQKGEWKPIESFGFPVLSAANDFANAPGGSYRHIYLYIDAANFTEPNLRKVFTGLSAEYPMPDNLSVSAFSDKAALQKALDNRSSGCVIYDKSPDGLRADRDRYLHIEPPKSGFFRAEYRRYYHADDECFWFSPDPDTVGELLLGCSGHHQFGK